MVKGDVSGGQNIEFDHKSWRLTRLRGRRSQEVSFYLIRCCGHLLHVALNHVLGFVTGAWNGETEFTL